MLTQPGTAQSILLLFLRQIRTDRICGAEGWPGGRNPWKGGVTAKGRRPEVTQASSVFPGYAIFLEVGVCE